MWNRVVVQSKKLPPLRARSLDSDSERLDMTKLSSSLTNRGAEKNRYKSKSKKKRRPNKLRGGGGEDAAVDVPRRVGCYCCCSRFQMTELREHVKKNCYALHMTRYRRVLHFKTSSGIMNEQRAEVGDVFVFPFGVLITWNLTVKQELEFIREFKPFTQNPLEDIETDNFDYYYWDKDSEVKNDIIFLSNGESENDDNKVKCAISMGIAQAIKLSIFEEEIDNLIKQTKQYPLELALNGQLSLSRFEIFKKMGQLWIHKNEVNLHSDILDRPEFFSENPSFLPLFEEVTDYLDVKQRIKSLESQINTNSQKISILLDG